MNILVLNWRDPKNPKSGGAEYVTYQHAKSWKRTGHNVTWFASYFPNAKREEIIDGIRIVRDGGSKTVFFHALLFYLRFKNTFDVIVDEIHGIPFFTPLYVRKPIVAFIHEVADEIWDYIFPPPFNYLGRITERMSLQLYKNIPFWTDAPSTIDDLAKVGIDRGHCIAIPCPIDIPSLKVLPKKESIPTFIFIGRLVRMKGVEDALAAFRAIKQSLVVAQLWIIGGGEETYVQKLKEEVKEFCLEESVQFFGFIPEKKKLELLQRAHVLLHPSVKEGWGLVVLEAASRATPTVGYNVSGLRDTVRSGSTGILVKRNSPSDMARKALELYEDKKTYATMQRACLRFANSFSWEEASGRSLNLLISSAKSH